MAVQKMPGELSQKLGVEMPITEQLAKVLFEGKPASSTISALMDRPSKMKQKKNFG